MEVAEIARMLADRAEDVAERYLPDGVREGANWQCSGSRSPTGYAIGVCLRGGKRGVVGFWGGGGAKGGDLIDLIQAVCGLTKRDAIREAKTFLGLLDDEPEDAPAKRAAARARAERARKVREDEEAADRVARVETARAIWQGCQNLPDTRGSGYLLQRGLPVWIAKEVRNLGYHPQLRHSSGAFLPAVVGRLTNVRNEFTGVWRIYLDPLMNIKASVKPNKVGLGVAAGSAVRLMGTKNGCRTLQVAEGIETTLGLIALRAWGMVSSPDAAVWATCSTSGMQALEVPPSCRRVEIFHDLDRVRAVHHDLDRVAEPPGEVAMLKLRERLEAKGVAVVSEPCRLGKDWLDLWNDVKMQPELLEP